MIYERIQKLASKILRKQADSLSIQEQREIVENFAEDYFWKIGQVKLAVGNELDTMLRLDPPAPSSALRRMHRIYTKVDSIYRMGDHKNPYPSVDALSKMVNSPDYITVAKSIIDMMEEHQRLHPVLKKEFSGLSNIKFGECFKRIAMVSWEADEFKNKHPVLLGKADMVSPDPSYGRADSNEKTFVPGKR